MATVKRLRVSLGTLVAVEAGAASESLALLAVEGAYEAIAEVDRRMRPQSQDSDLARINEAPLHTRIRVHASICELLNLARRLNTLTHGVFDPCLPIRPGRLTDIDVADDQVICNAPAALDFGGFAKGYAVDRAIEALKSSGCTAGLVNAGGDLRVFGPRTDPILVRSRSGELRRVALGDAALAVSDADSQGRPLEHRGYYLRGRTRQDPLVSNHLEGRAGHDPLVHNHLEGHASCDPLVRRFAAVIANEAVIADALAKCVLLCPKDTAELALRAFGATQLTGQ